MYECPRCHYQTIKKNDLKCHFHRKNICHPIYENISQSILRIKVQKRNAFKIENEKLNQKNQIEEKTESFNSLNQKLNQNLKKNQCEHCLKILSRTSSLNRHFLTCKKKKEYEENKKKEEIKKDEILKKNMIIQNNIKHIELLQKELNNIKLELKEEKMKKICLEENIEDKSKYVNKELFSNKKKKIPLTLRYKIWLNKYGESFNGDCYCCSKEINITNFHCGHIISRKDNGLINEDNLRPICQTCNLSMGSQNMEEFKQKFFNI